MRIANYRAQAVRDADIFKKGLEEFKQIDPLLAKMTPLVHQEEGKRQLEAIKTDLKHYLEMLAQQSAIQQRLDQMMEKRSKAAYAMQDACDALVQSANAGLLPSPPIPPRV